MFKLGAQVGVRTFLSSFLKSAVADRVKKENLGFINGHFVRTTSFFTRITKQQLWKGVLSVSNAGRRKGRGRGRDSIHQKSSTGTSLGEGKLRVSWPGLNTHVLTGSKVTAIKPLPEPQSQALERPERKTRKSKTVHPLDRGWSGSIIPGRKLGPPESTGTFKGFESVVLIYKSRPVMTANFGKRRQFLSVIATGNGNGLLGLAESIKFDKKISLEDAKKKASKKLITIDLIEKHTVNHDFCSEYRNTKVFVSKKPKGYGLRCHRAITAICKLIGIENLHAKVEGPCNVSNVIRAFVVGLLRQKTYQQIADENKLHLVEFKEECCNFPLVLASPKDCLTLSERRRNPVLFDEYIMDNRFVHHRERKVPFYQKLPSWRTYLLRTLFRRNHEEVKIDLQVKYGAYNSHLTAIYPECTNLILHKKQEESSLE